MPSIFSRIVAGDIPCHKIAEDDRFLAFLDIQPLAEGHTLVIPKLEVDRYFDLPDDLLRDINLFARDVALQLERAIPCQRVGVAVIGLEVPHAHVHLIPLNGVADINFERPKLDVSQDDLAATAAKIRQAAQSSKSGCIFAREGVVDEQADQFRGGHPHQEIPRACCGMMLISERSPEPSIDLHDVGRAIVVDEVHPIQAPSRIQRQSRSR